MSEGPQLGVYRCVADDCRVQSYVVTQDARCPGCGVKGKLAVPPLVRAILPPRQVEVARLIAQGLTTKEISVQLHISPKTVEYHRNMIYNKLGLRTVAELTRWAVKEKIAD